MTVMDPVQRCRLETKTMPTLPQLSDLASLVATLDKHPFGTLACIVLAVIVLAAIVVVRRREK